MNKFSFLNAIVDQAKLKDTAKEYAEKLIKKPYFTLIQQKELFETWQNSSLDYAIQDSVNNFALAFTTEVSLQKIDEFFLNKR